MDIADDDIFERTDSVLHADLDDAIAMMNIETGEYYNLNPAGSRIWTLLETPMSLKAICEALVAEFDVSIEDCRTQTAAFLNDLLRLTMVRRAVH
jgi:hypothetical protein